MYRILAKVHGKLLTTQLLVTVIRDGESRRQKYYSSGDTIVSQWRERERDGEAPYLAKAETSSSCWLWD